MKTMGNEVWLEVGLYIISNVSRELNLLTGKFVELFNVMLQLNPLKTLNRPSSADNWIDSP